MTRLEHLWVRVSRLVSVGLAAVIIVGGASVASASGPQAKQPGESAYAAMSQAISMEEIRGMLKKAKGIGLWTKLTLATNVNRFTEDFYWFHKRSDGKTLVEMRKRFDQLHQRIVEILRPDNPDLTARFVAARDALWHAYRDPIAYANSVGKDVIARIERPGGNMMSIISSF